MGFESVRINPFNQKKNTSAQKTRMELLHEFYPATWRDSQRFSLERTSLALAEEHDFSLSQGEVRRLKPAIGIDVSAQTKPLLSFANIISDLTKTYYDQRKTRWIKGYTNDPTNLFCGFLYNDCYGFIANADSSQDTLEYLTELQGYLFKIRTEGQVAKDGKKRGVFYHDGQTEDTMGRLLKNVIAQVKHAKRRVAADIEISKARDAFTIIMNSTRNMTDTLSKYLFFALSDQPIAKANVSITAVHTVNTQALKQAVSSRAGNLMLQLAFDPRLARAVNIDQASYSVVAHEGTIFTSQDLEGSANVEGSTDLRARLLGTEDAVLTKEQRKLSSGVCQLVIDKANSVSSGGGERELLSEWVELQRLLLVFAEYQQLMRQFWGMSVFGGTAIYGFSQVSQVTIEIMREFKTFNTEFNARIEQWHMRIDRVNHQMEHTSDPSVSWWESNYATAVTHKQKLVEYFKQCNKQVDNILSQVTNVEALNKRARAADDAFAQVKIAYNGINRLRARVGLDERAIPELPSLSPTSKKLSPAGKKAAPLSPPSSRDRSSASPEYAQEAAEAERPEPLFKTVVKPRKGKKKKRSSSSSSSGANTRSASKRVAKNTSKPAPHAPASRAEAEPQKTQKKVTTSAPAASPSLSPEAAPVAPVAPVVAASATPEPTPRITEALTITELLHMLESRSAENGEQAIPVSVKERKVPKELANSLQANRRDLSIAIQNIRAAKLDSSESINQTLTQIATAQTQLDQAITATKKARAGYWWFLPWHWGRISQIKACRKVFVGVKGELEQRQSQADVRAHSIHKIEQYGTLAQQLEDYLTTRKEMTLAQALSAKHVIFAVNRGNTDQENQAQQAAKARVLAAAPKFVEPENDEIRPWRDVLQLFLSIGDKPLLIAHAKKLLDGPDGLDSRVHNVPLLFLLLSNDHFSQMLKNNDLIEFNAYFAQALSSHITKLSSDMDSFNDLQVDRRGGYSEEKTRLILNKLRELNIPNILSVERAAGHHLALIKAKKLKKQEKLDQETRLLELLREQNTWLKEETLKQQQLQKKQAAELKVKTFINDYFWENLDDGANNSKDAHFNSKRDELLAAIKAHPELSLKAAKAYVSRIDSTGKGSRPHLADVLLAIGDKKLLEEYCARCFACWNKNVPGLLAFLQDKNKKGVLPILKANNFSSPTGREAKDALLALLDVPSRFSSIRNRTKIMSFVTALEPYKDHGMGEVHQGFLQRLQALALAEKHQREGRIKQLGDAVIQYVKKHTYKPELPTVEKHVDRAIFEIKLPIHIAKYRLANLSLCQKFLEKIPPWNIDFKNNNVLHLRIPFEEITEAFIKEIKCLPKPKQWKDHKETYQLACLLDGYFSAYFPATWTPALRDAGLEFAFVEVITSCRQPKENKVLYAMVRKVFPDATIHGLSGNKYDQRIAIPWTMLTKDKVACFKPEVLKAYANKPLADSLEQGIKTFLDSQPDLVSFTSKIPALDVLKINIHGNSVKAKAVRSWITWNFPEAFTKQTKSVSYGSKSESEIAQINLASLTQAQIDGLPQALTAYETAEKLRRASVEKEAVLLRQQIEAYWTNPSMTFVKDYTPGAEKLTIKIKENASQKRAILAQLKTVFGDKAQLKQSSKSRSWYFSEMILPLASLTEANVAKCTSEQFTAKAAELAEKQAEEDAQADQNAQELMQKFDAYFGAPGSVVLEKAAGRIQFNVLRKVTKEQTVALTKAFTALSPAIFSYLNPQYKYGKRYEISNQVLAGFSVKDFALKGGKIAASASQSASVPVSSIPAPASASSLSSGSSSQLPLPANKTSNGKGAQPPQDDHPHPGTASGSAG